MGRPILAKNKLNEEHTLYLLRALACGRPFANIRKEFGEVYGFGVKQWQLARLKQSERWEPVYDKMRLEYIAKAGSLMDIPISQKRTRLEVAQSLLERVLSETYDSKQKSRIETALKVLTYVEKESNDVAKAVGSGSLLQFVDKQQVIQREPNVESTDVNERPNPTHN